MCDNTVQYRDDDMTCDKKIKIKKIKTPKTMGSPVIPNTPPTLTDRNSSTLRPIEEIPTVSALSSDIWHYGKAARQSCAEEFRGKYIFQQQWLTVSLKTEKSTC